jgi:hypothetical protein
MIAYPLFLLRYSEIIKEINGVMLLLNPQAPMIDFKYEAFRRYSLVDL